MTTSSIGPGAVLGGRYRLDDLLSETDGARFWRGTDTVLGRSVAVHAVSSNDPRAARLLDAARRSATVVDAHLLRVLDCQPDPDVTWVVNEWGEGTSLDVMVQRGGLPAGRASWLSREVAETIAGAHRVGVAHGRLTPESVLITEAGAVKLIGFVITGAIEGLACDEPRAAERGYHEIGPLEADVIDLAGILYAAMTGRWPGISPSGVADAPTDHHGPLRPRQVRAGVPRMLDAICERVLRKEAYEHTLPLETAQEILAALDDQVGDPATMAPFDVPSMYVEPTVSLRRDQLGDLPGLAGLPATGDPEATQAAPRPQWDDDGARDRRVSDTVEPVLPPWDESADRPLFASAERRTPPTGSAERGSSAWLFGDDEPPPVARKQPHRSRAWLIPLVVVLVAAATYGAFRLGLGNSNSPSGSPSTSPSATPTATTGAVLRPVSVHDFDPQGHPPKENPAEVPLATDGNPNTGWTTSTYTTAALGGLKSGVGLLVDLGKDDRLATVHLTLRGSPTSVAIYASPTGDTIAPTGIGGLTRVGSITSQQPATTIRISQPVRTRFVVIWLTNLPRYGHGYRGEIDEFTLSS